MNQTAPSADTLRALETAPNMYLILSPDLYILTASNLYLEAIETSRETIIGRHIFDAFPGNPDLPEDDGVQKINASLQEVLRTKKTHVMQIQRYDVPVRDKPGQFIHRYWDPSHTPVLDARGEIQYIIQLATNVTERILMEEALASSRIQHQQSVESERHFRHLADLVPAKISNALPSGEVTYFNKQWLDYSKLNFEDLRDFGYHNMMHPDEIAEFTAGLAVAAQDGKPFEMEMRFKNNDGLYRWHLNIASPVMNENSEISMWVGSTTDIQRIKEEEQRKTDFIGMVSHELKTPLTSLSGYLQILNSKAKKAGDTFATGAIERASNQVKRMTSMINGFLNVSRLESAKIHIDKENFDISILMKEVEEESISTISGHRIIFQPLQHTFVMADRDKISQVFHNLISNAVKYSPADTIITVSCETLSNKARICVRDQGAGIKPEDQHRLFERYYRVEGPNTKNIAGFGIGLYLCAEIIKRHDGEIWVESDGTTGSSFYFSLLLTQ